ncbi:MAG: site-specific DNA-methyltransferase [bacterium]|nr:site-specific DNA-methyltransferase [bacterium]
MPVQARKTNSDKSNAQAKRPLRIVPDAAKSAESSKSRAADKKKNRAGRVSVPGFSMPFYVGELWTARQRQMHPLHYTVSYRASFKPELPDFFIRRFLLDRRITEGVVLDPFGGRGTTVLQANLLGFRGIHNDLNPVSIFLSSARQQIPPLAELIERTEALDLGARRFRLNAIEKKRLLPFFHPETLNEILNLREQLLQTIQAGPAAGVDPALQYIGLTALSRLHGHSDGFFSVYSFPQISIMPEAQARNNLRRNQTPEYRGVKARIIKKMKADLGSAELAPEFLAAAAKNRYTMSDARKLKGLRANTVDLVVTSPPFLDKVNYVADNWMRSWFLGYDAEPELTMTPDVGEWVEFMAGVMRDLGRVLKPGARAVIEVGEVAVGQKGANLNLEELLIKQLPMTLRGGGGRLVAEEVFINSQEFTKLANCWDVKNNAKGTNTNRCLVVRKLV